VPFTQQAGLTDEEMARKYAGADMVLFPALLRALVYRLSKDRRRAGLSLPAI